RMTRPRHMQTGAPRGRTYRCPTLGGSGSSLRSSRYGLQCCALMPDLWPSLNYADWSDTCDTLHAHTQVLGKLAVALAPPEPQLQHAALRLTARGWETLPLPAPDGSG